MLAIVPRGDVLYWSRGLYRDSPDWDVVFERSWSTGETRALAVGQLTGEGDIQARALYVDTNGVFVSDARHQHMLHLER